MQGCMFNMQAGYLRKESRRDSMNGSQEPKESEGATCTRGSV